MFHETFFLISISNIEFETNLCDEQYVMHTFTELETEVVTGDSNLRDKQCSLI